ncbi:MAG TPA: MarR family winged helix-turn-helix transcriptional regulator [Streptosporangiaceae bacterium]|jgi:DNA-binding MarR family transcriptional regulator
MEKQAPLRQLTADPGFLLSRVGAAARAGFRDVLAGWDIRPLQYLILLILSARDGVSQQELCTAAGVDSGNMVELVDGLEALRYAQRSRDARDRRRYVVTVTAAGRSALAGMHEAVEEYNRGFLSPLTGQEQRQLANMLGKLYVTTAQGQPGTPLPGP